MVSDEINNPLERMDDIGCCWRLITDLTCSSSADDDLNIVNRDKMSSALNFLQTEYEKASEKLHLAIQKELKNVSSISDAQSVSHPNT